MRMNRMAGWAVLAIACFAALLLLLKGLSLHGSASYVFIEHGPGRGGQGGGFMVLQKAERYEPFALLYSSVWMALKLAVLGASIWLWTKSSGILRGASIAAAGLALMSLLSPIGGALLVIAMLIIKPKRKEAPAVTHVNTAVDNGAFLDEWERNART